MAVTFSITKASPTASASCIRTAIASRRAGEVERVTVDVPADELADEEYVLTLSAPGDGGVVADYLFRVVRR